MDVKNGVSAIADEVIGAAQKEAETVILEAESNAKEILRRAKEQAEQIHQEVLSKANVKIEVEKRKIASVTEVDIRNSLLQAKEDLVDVAFEKALAKIKNFVASEEYHDYFLKIVKDAAEKLGQKNLILQVNAKDYEWITRKALKDLSAQLHLELKLSDKTEDYLGGCKIHTADDKIIFDATIDNRLQELKPILRVMVAKKLFGEL
ncbi:MAG: V-type ATP synthase subunit E [Candidatus Bathyarchaeia archaeon]|jgi:V/A-type H+-transporting ATPase subunit E